MRFQPFKPHILEALIAAEDGPPSKTPPSTESMYHFRVQDVPEPQSAPQEGE